MTNKNYAKSRQRFRLMILSNLKLENKKSLSHITLNLSINFILSLTKTFAKHETAKTNDISSDRQIQRMRKEQIMCITILLSFQKTTFYNGKCHCSRQQPK